MYHRCESCESDKVRWIAEEIYGDAKMSSFPSLRDIKVSLNGAGEGS